VELARQADAREARAAAEAPPGDPIWPKNLAFSMVNRAHCPGTPSLQKIASTGHTASQAPQPAPTPGWMQSIRSPS